jgi:hypothetical protein
MGHGKAEQCIARFRQDLLGIAKVANVLLSRQRQQHSAQQQGDDEQHDREFDQGEAALRGIRRLRFGFSSIHAKLDASYAIFA